MTAATPFDVFNCPLDGTRLIEASAGTGKTWNICGLYLRLLLERELEVQQILVVTFTNAATAELRDRIRSRIAEMRDHLSGQSPAATDPFIHDLTETLEHQRGIERSQLAARLELALQTFDEASIFTIHGFCQRALADSAFAAGQSFVLELQPDDSDLMMEAVHDFWRQHIASNPIGMQLATYLLQKKDTPEKFAALLKRHLAKPLAQNLWPDAKPPVFDHTALVGAYAAAQTNWATNREKIVELLKSSKDLKQTSYKPASIDSAVTDYDAFFSAGDPFNGNIRDTKLDLLRSSRLAVGEGTKIKGVPPQHAFFDLADTLLTEREQAEQALEYARLALIRTMLDETARTVHQRKRERRLLSFNDILFNVHAALHNNDGLAESLRQRFPAALVDEFQDTDPLQFSVFNAIYGATENPLFLVGDPKQAIYRFRNADLDTYLSAKQQTSAIYSISHNQRSTQNLINALNDLFSANRQAFMLPGLDYQRVGFGSKPRKQFEDHSGPNADLQLWMLPKLEDGNYIERKRAKQFAVDATAGEIARLLNAAATGEIKIDGQPLRAGDIAVLVRTHAQGSAIRQALANLNVGSVELSQNSVFKSADAEEVERVLTAIWSPARLPLLRAALATELLGCDAGELAALSADEAQLMQKIQAFSDYRNLWLQRGIGFVYRHLLSKEGVSARMLRRPDGERRMTNLLHLGELLHQAAETHPAPDALLRWLQTQRRETATDEAAQLRLESDRNLVQIMTIHKAKGLEFPVVFCPFLWDGHRRANNGPEGREYHDEQGNTVIDFRSKPDDDAVIKEKIALESDAEDLRLIYVALTRAVYRCYLVAGCYSRSYFGKLSNSESTRSLLNWLAAGNGYSASEWRNSKKNGQTTDSIEQAWQQLADNNQQAIGLTDLPQNMGEPIYIDLPAPETLVCQPMPTFIPSGWRISSYSGLSRGAVHENAASDHDSLLPPLPLDATPRVLPDDDILRFPKGANAGDCIHRAFELCDFPNPETWDSAITQALSEHPQNDLANDRGLTAMMRRMMHDVLNTSLPDGIVLGKLARQKRLTELGFHLPSSRLSANTLNQTLRRLDYDVPRLSFGDLECYLKGFIDLVFEHQGRFYILDWKSNHLGFDIADYDAPSLAQAMAGNGYHLQHLLYSVALNRYLARRVRGYRYETHFGGVLYLFVRGVRPDWKNADGAASGVYFHRPDKHAIRQLDALFASDSAQAA